MKNKTTFSILLFFFFGILINFRTLKLMFASKWEASALHGTQFMTIRNVGDRVKKMTNRSDQNHRTTKSQTKVDSIITL